ncbi:hypothetical protein FB446DRAFT_772931 [Lentinula raphanica]|nr:hypothetical protein FB446DRAFT_772931 [Lentinula raphanica]
MQKAFERNNETYFNSLSSSKTCSSSTSGPGPDSSSFQSLFVEYINGMVCAGNKRGYTGKFGESAEDCDRWVALGGVDDEAEDEERLPKEAQMFFSVQTPVGQADMTPEEAEHADTKSRQGSWVWLDENMWRHTKVPKRVALIPAVVVYVPVVLTLWDDGMRPRRGREEERKNGASSV